MDVSSMSYADYGRWYISSAECKAYPFYGAQFHSELNTFDWDSEDAVSHSYEGIMLQQHCANFFVNEARKNCHSFPNQAAENYSLLYNWNANPDYALYFFQTVNTSQSAWPGLYNISSN